MRKILYHYEDTKAMTRSLLEWIDDPASKNCTSLEFSANCTLAKEASRALVQSALAHTVRRMEFTEICFSPEQLADLLSMPALVEMRILGGVSYDWAGPEYIYPTLDTEHITVFVTNPHAQRLQILEIEKHNFSDQLGHKLRNALPNLKTLWVEGRNY